MIACDFCGSSLSLSEALRKANAPRNEAKAFRAPNGSQWLSCAGCARLAATGEPDPLAVRVARTGEKAWVVVARENGHADAVRDVLRDAYRAVLPCLDGPCDPIETPLETQRVPRQTRAEGRARRPHLHSHPERGGSDRQGAPS